MIIGHSDMDVESVLDIIQVPGIPETDHFLPVGCGGCSGTETEKEDYHFVLDVYYTFR